MRLHREEIEGLLRLWPRGHHDLALALRTVVLDLAPELDETIAYRSLCYSKPGRPYGVIGGNVCMVGTRGERLHLAFLHGAFLPDPDGLLEGTAKAKRYIEVRAPGDIKRRVLERLIRAAIAHEPAT